MARLTNQPEPYAIVVIVPKDGPGQAAVTHTVNGRVARIIQWVINHRPQIELPRKGSLVFNYGPSSLQADIRESFLQQGVVPSENPTENRSD